MNGPKPRGPGGRPPKINADIITRMCCLLLDGNYLNVAVARCGITYRTYERWKSLGRRYPDGIYGEFCRSIQEAIAEAEITRVKFWTDAAAVDWHAAVAWLERKFPERWSKDRQEMKAMRKRLEELEKYVSGQQIQTPAGSP